MAKVVRALTDVFTALALKGQWVNGSMGQSVWGQEQLWQEVAGGGSGEVAQ